MLENAMARRVLHTVWDIRRKDFIEDKIEYCLLRCAVIPKPVTITYSAVLKFGYAKFLALYTTEFPAFFAALCFSNTHHKSVANMLNGNSPPLEGWQKFREFLTGWFSRDK